jgi:hypothetical protein
MRYLVLTPNLGLWYLKGSRFDLLRYLDADYAGCKVNKKKYLWDLPIYWEVPCLLVFKEIKIRCPIHGRSGVCYRR